MNNATNTANAPRYFDLVSLLADTKVATPATTRPTTRVPAMTDAPAHTLANRLDKLAHDVRAGRLVAGDVVAIESLLNGIHVRTGGRGAR